MNPDNLEAPVRAFFEQTKLKMAFSLIFAALGMMMLGFCSAQGGYSTSQRLFELSYNNQAGSGNIYSDVENSFQANIGGSGFASTSQLFGSILMFIVALYLSPICFGSPNEFKAYAALHELEGAQISQTTAAPETVNPLAVKQPSSTGAGGAVQKEQKEEQPESIEEIKV